MPCGGAWMILRTWSLRFRPLLLLPKPQDGSFAMRRFRLVLLLLRSLMAKAPMLNLTWDACCTVGHRLSDDAWALLWARTPLPPLRLLPL